MLLITIFSCKVEPNHDRKDTKGEAFYVEESVALNVYDLEFEGYRLLVFKEIHNSNGEEKIVSVILDPRYEQPPTYKITKTINIDTLLQLDKPIQVELEKSDKKEE